MLTIKVPVAVAADNILKHISFFFFFFFFFVLQRL